MADVINLNKARKARSKAARKTEAAQHRAKFGRAKTETTATRSEHDKLRRALDDARRDKPERGED
jgi:hypothetical protein